jgi:ATP-binding cassette subfamily F protein uup
VENLEITAATTRLGRSVITLDNISKSFDKKTLISNFSYIVKRQDKIGIVGANGSGKSTLLKMILNQIPPDDGEVRIGKTVKIAYFSQENESLDESLRVIDYIRESGEFLLSTNGNAYQLQKCLIDFCFQVRYNTIILRGFQEARNEDCTC